MKTDNIIVTKSKTFALRIINLNKYLCNDKKEYTMSTQILKSGTSIGANVKEAIRGQSKADFYSKMNIALKEANETQYWMKLLYKTEYISEKEYLSIENDIREIIAILVSICKRTNK